MLDLFVAIRNFTIAILLAWMGFSVAPDNEDETETTSAPNSSAIGFIAR